MCPGQGHWQNGVVERHIGVFKGTFEKLLLERANEFPEDQALSEDEIQALISETTHIKTTSAGMVVPVLLSG